MNEYRLQQVAKIKKHSDLFEKIITNSANDTEMLGFLREKATKSFIIDVYTFWESFVKDLIYDTLKSNSLLIISENFISKYTSDVLEGNKYIKEQFTKSFKEKKLFLTKEIISNSNNLDYDSLYKMIKRLFPSLKKEELTLFLMTQKKLNKRIEKLKDLGVSKEDLESDISGYLKLLVSNRNMIAHSHEVDIRYSCTQRSALIYFIKELATSISIFIRSNLIHRKLDLGYSFYELPITSVYNCNNKANPGVVSLDIASYKGNSNPKTTEFFLKYNINETDDTTSENGIIVEQSTEISKSIYYEKLEVKSIRNENRNYCSVLPKKGKRSISFTCTKEINRNDVYSIIEICSNPEDMETYGLEVVVENLGLNL